MKKSFDAMKVQAEALYEKIRDLDKASAVLEIVREFIDVTADGHREAMDAMETSLLHKEHH